MKLIRSTSNVNIAQLLQFTGMLYIPQPEGAEAKNANHQYFYKSQAKEKLEVN